MNKSLKIVVLILLGVSVQAQDQSNVIPQSGMVALSPFYQRWSLNGNELFTQSGADLAWYQPLGRAASLFARAAYAATNGNVQSISGLTDVQVTGSYYVEEADLVFSLGINIPTGKKRLNMPAFGTSFLISNSIFRAQVPHYGMGLNFSPAITWALPLSASVVTGLGVSYQYRGSYAPIDGFGDFDSGDEVSAATGIDIKLDAASTLSLNLLFTRFMKDRVNNVEVFGSGSRLLLAMEFKRAFGFDELRLAGFYRRRSAVQQFGPVAQFATQERIEPDQLELAAMFSIRLGKAAQLLLGADLRIQEQTSVFFSGATIASIGVSPVFTVSEHLQLPIRLKYSTGTLPGDSSLKGFEAGLGIVMTYH